ncbi:MAG: zf-HC2 domain-containing protein [Anaerolineae bacterium]
MLGLPEKDRTNEHRYIEEQLSAYLDGELAARDRAAVEHHLAECPACQWNLDTLRQTVQWSRELPTVSIPRVFTVPVPPEPVKAPRWGWMTPVLQGATALVALLLFFVVAGDLVLTRTLPSGSLAPAAVQGEAPADVVMPPPAPQATQPLLVEGEASLTVVETVVLEMEAPLAQEVPEMEMAVTEPVEEAAAAEPAEETVPGEATTEAEMRSMTAPTFGTPAEEGLGSGGVGEASDAEKVVEASPLPVPTPAPLATTTLESEAAMPQVVPTPSMAPTFAVAESERQATPTLIARIEEDETAPDSEDAWGTGYDPLTVGFRVAEGVLLVLLLGLAMATAVVMIQRRRARR